MSFLLNAQTRIVSLDASDEENEALLESLGVEGFPTLLVYRDGKRLPDYSGSRKAGWVYVKSHQDYDRRFLPRPLSE